MILELSDFDAKNSEDLIEELREWLFRSDIRWYLHDECIDPEHFEHEDWEEIARALLEKGEYYL